MRLGAPEQFHDGKLEALVLLSRTVRSRHLAGQCRGEVGVAPEGQELVSPATQMPPRRGRGHVPEFAESVPAPSAIRYPVGFLPAPRAGVVEKVAEKVVRRRLSALELAPAAVGRPVAQPTRVLEGWLLGSERGSAPVGAEKSSARRVGVFGLTHGSALAAPGCSLTYGVRASLPRGWIGPPGGVMRTEPTAAAPPQGSTWSLSVAVDPCPSPSDGPAGALAQAARYSLMSPAQVVRRSTLRPDGCSITEQPASSGACWTRARWGR